jgi:hypothetical protein
MATQHEHLTDWDARRRHLEDQADLEVFEGLASSVLAVGGLSYAIISGNKRGVVIAGAAVGLAINRFKAFNLHNKQAEVAADTHNRVTGLMLEHSINGHQLPETV